MIEIRAVDPGDADIVPLIEALDHYQLTLYPVESNHLDSVDTLCEPNVYFIAAYDESGVLGCGAIKYLEDDVEYGEIKRVFVNENARGKGVSKKIMAALEQNALDQNISFVRLETGIYQPEAIGLYERLGYDRRDSFGDYPDDDPMSVFMEKKLKAVS